MIQLNFKTKISVVLITLFFLTVNTAFASHSSELENQLSKSKSLYNEAIKNIEDLEIQMEKLDSQIEKNIISIENTDNNIADLKVSIAKTENQIKKIETDIANEQKLFGERVEALYVNNSTSYIDVLLESENFSDFMTRVETVKTLILYDNQIIDTLSSNKNDLSSKKQQFEKEQNNLLALQKRNNEETATLKLKKNEQKVLNANLKSEKSNYSADIKVYEEAIVKQSSLERESSSVNEKIDNSTSNVINDTNSAPASYDVNVASSTKSKPNNNYSSSVKSSTNINAKSNSIGNSKYTSNHSYSKNTDENASDTDNLKNNHKTINNKEYDSNTNKNDAKDIDKSAISENDSNKTVKNHSVKTTSKKTSSKNSLEEPKNNKADSKTTDKDNVNSNDSRNDYKDTIENNSSKKSDEDEVVVSKNNSKNSNKTTIEDSKQSSSDNEKSTSSSSIISYARQFKGIPYVWGGTSPSGFDCSGFTYYVYKNSAGINIPRTSGSQAGVGTYVSSKSNLQPGDLVFFGSPTHHVGIYTGNGNYIHSPKTGDVIKEVPMTRSDFTHGRRLL